MSQESQTEVAEPVVANVRPKRKPRPKNKRQPRYNVILWNDDDHTYPYVMTMLAELFGYPMEQGYQLAHEVDTTGRAIVFTTALEHAEFKRDQIHAYGKDGLIENCQGSMWATVEPCPAE